MKCASGATDCIYYCCISQSCLISAALDMGLDFGIGSCERSTDITTRDLQEIDESEAGKYGQNMGT